MSLIAQIRIVIPCVYHFTKDKLVEISGGHLIVADVSTASAAIIKANDAEAIEKSATTHFPPDISTSLSFLIN